MSISSFRPRGRRDMMKLGLAGLAAPALLALPGGAEAAPAASLVSAAKKGGKLNVIALPRDWANYGEMLDTFAKLYGIKIDSANPDGSSAQELQALRTLKGQARCPDAVDVGPAFALIGKKDGLFQPYKVSTWNSIPADMKDAGGAWVGDYFGLVSFAANRSVVKNMPASWADLKKPEYKGMIALNGNPVGAAAAFAAVFAAALANGGSYGNIEPGVHFFGELAKLGNLNPAKATPAGLVGGQTPITIDWDYLSLGYRQTAKGKADVTVGIPQGSPSYGSFYCQGITKWAPNTAAAKLWMEFMYSDQGQLIFLKGFAHPARYADLVKRGVVPAALAAELPPAAAYEGVKFASQDQLSKGQKVVADLWPKLVKI